MIKIAARSSLSVIAVFFIVSIIAFSSIKISALSFIGTESSKTDSFLYVLSLENHSLHSVMPIQPDRSLGKVVLEILTNINLADMRTFLFTEIPGLYASSPKILIAGQGTDFTNLPIESPPPQDFGMYDEPDESELPTKDEEKELTNDYIAYIYHSHTWESFYPLVDGKKDPSSREKNVTLLGKRLGEKLEERGIKTLVDNADIQEKLLKRGMKYGQSYTMSRESVVEAMGQNKQLQLMFDIHRDSARKHVTTKEINGKPYAKLYFVVGTAHPNYGKNLQFAGKLNKLLEKKYPGLSRGVLDKSKTEGNGIYNQDLFDHNLVIEIGGVDNNLEELNRTVDALAEVISNYYWGEAMEASKNK
ncbi:stage II sporulation protein P [Bacillus sp. FJAT-49711]|uniref:stage II sporulation protein P n=1 Tax=Bacillus sp. FJAT-49711 TaxID=2833585 RepID=UPI001BC8CE67|nr:stage II sporulation protein P [Bacillus sp. FJAT-49711]MBS4217652.1 stage II sporulation protein P [Bacillus sp. FJAT-49711]